MSRPLSEIDRESIGGLFTQLVDDGKGFARAEAELYKQLALQKVQKSKVGVALALTGYLVICGAIAALLVGFVLGLAPHVGPVLAGIIVGVVGLAIGGGLIYLGVRSLSAAFAASNGSSGR